MRKTTDYYYLVFKRRYRDYYELSYFSTDKKEIQRAYDEMRAMYPTYYIRMIKRRVNNNNDPIDTFHI